MRKGDKANMEVDYIKPFLIASCSVLKSAANIEVDIENIYLKSCPPNKDQLLFSAPIKGKYQGRAVLGMSKETACTIASGMLKRASVTELDDLAFSAITEMANMILGNTMTIFSLIEAALDISLTLMPCPNMPINCLNEKILCVPLRGASHNVIELNLVLTDDKEPNV
jgi:chemotaxis protein CheX